MVEMIKVLLGSQLPIQKMNGSCLTQVLKELLLKPV